MTLAATLILIGRVVLGLFFIIAALRNFRALGATEAYATNYGFNLPKGIAAVGFLAQLVGGLSVALGIMPAAGAALIILFLIGATSLFHNLFLFSGEAQKPHLYFTLVNLALAGYCLMVIGLAL